MSLPVFVQDPAGRREVPASEFPLTLGGTGPGARPLPGWINVSPAVTLHLGETGVSIEPCAPDVPLSINRKRLPGRVALVDGDNVRIGEAEIRVSVGDEVVLLGASGTERIGVEELAALMGTITYEVTCLITARVPRTYSTYSSRA